MASANNNNLPQQQGITNTKMNVIPGKDDDISPKSAMTKVNYKVNNRQSSSTIQVIFEPNPARGRTLKELSLEKNALNSMQGEQTSARKEPPGV